ncbi:MBL fold metallo-hydrolase [Pelosinus sp. sgz500959]|uniref:MBL fold metallo-hydrolase n=1 Tax=Pelosinus sp. sgz500959 TaxID=3242472 RepID=UPI00366DB171
MQVHVLASGSTGNAIFLDFNHTKILVDAGISTRRIKNSLAELGTSIEELDGVFITHEHRDHVNGLATMTKKYNTAVYASMNTWSAMYCRDLIPDQCCKVLPGSLRIGQVQVEPFSISHDAADPVGFRFYNGDHKCSIVTDLGFVTDTVKKAIALSDVLVLESNHDIEMLEKGAYPWHLKRRILSNRGHLSNFDAGWTLARLERKPSMQVFLAHMSQQNNDPDLAMETVSSILTQQGCKLGSEIELYRTYPDRIVSSNL